MPPLNSYVFEDEPLLVSNGRSLNPLRSGSPSSFERESGCEDPQFDFAVPAPRRQKSVCFNKRVEIEYLPSHYDWTEDERKSRWNSEEDYTNFQVDIFNTIYLSRNAPEALDDTHHSYRGVECRDPIMRRRRRQWKKEAWDAVFLRQAIQRQMNDETDGYNHLVAGMYSNASQPSMRAALNLAAQDEIDANQIRSEDNQSRHEEETDCFSHSWISTTYSSQSDESSWISNSIEASSTSDNSEEVGFCVLGEKSGFDNSWLQLEI